MALTKVGKEGVTGISNSSNATAITIDSSENVGIGTTTPAGANGIALTVNATTNPRFRLTSDNTGTGSTDGSGIFLNNSDMYISNEESAPMIFRTSATERMRILSDGRTCIGHNAAINISILGISNRNATSDRMFAVHNAGGTSGYFNQIAFRNNADSATIGEIVRVNDASVSYNTTSDYRLKTAVNYDWDATTRLKQLKPARFKWISDGDDAVPVDGFLAHEAQAVVPESVTGTHDEVDADGNPVYQGIDQSKLVPLLVKTIQELEARITALENV